jgi:hypothetical protein
MNRCVYIFLDESGNFDFSAKGTRYFVLTSVSMKRPFPAVMSMDDYKHDRLEYGLDLEYFHCYHDGKTVRNRVFDLIASHLDGMRIDSLVVEKAKAEPVLQEDRHFYPELLTRLLKLIMPVELDDGGMEKVIVITDTIPVNKKWRAIERGIQTALHGVLPPGMKYRILHHQSRSHYGLQVADYCCWAIFRKWQTGERTWYDRIKPAIRRELDLFHAKSRYYY